MSHLLLVDDDEDILSLLTAFFRKHGHLVSTAATGAEMFAVLEGEPIDIVILDVMLQNDDGFDLCRRLRAASPMPVIMLTGMADSTDRVVELEIGADDYLTKPFDPRELLARVKAVLRRTVEKVSHQRAVRRGLCCASPAGVSTSRAANCARRTMCWCCYRAVSLICCWPSSSIRNAS
jgi:two-component system, OmpR family, response regulator